jgi:hypothetical protein
MLDYDLRQRRTPEVRLARVKIKSELTAKGVRFALVRGNGRRIECGPAELSQLIDAAERA